MYRIPLILCHRCFFRW